MRPLKYGEEMIRVDLRIPKSSSGAFKVLVRDFLRKYEIVGEMANTAKAKKIEPELMNVPAKPKWVIDAEERMKRNKL